MINELAVMNQIKERSRRYIYVGVILTALGVVFSTLLREQVGAIGIIFILIGVFFTLVGFNMRKNKH